METVTLSLIYGISFLLYRIVGLNGQCKLLNGTNAAVRVAFIVKLAVGDADINVE